MICRTGPSDPITGSSAPAGVDVIGLKPRSIRLCLIDPLTIGAGEKLSAQADAEDRPVRIGEAAHQVEQARDIGAGSIVRCRLRASQDDSAVEAAGISRKRIIFGRRDGDKVGAEFSEVVTEQADRRCPAVLDDKDTQDGGSHQLRGKIGRRTRSKRSRL